MLQNVYLTISMIEYEFTNKRAKVNKDMHVTFVKEKVRLRFNVGQNQKGKFPLRLGRGSPQNLANINLIL